MDKKLYDAFNEQLKNELYSAYLYLSMAAYLDYIKLKGFAHWMKVQFKEEQAHAMRLYDFLNKRGEKVILKEIPRPPIEFSSAQDIFEKTLAHERGVSGLINALNQLATQVKDSQANNFLEWFIKEQVEEEETAAGILEKIKSAGSDSEKLIALDGELAKRINKT